MQISQQMEPAQQPDSNIETLKIMIDFESMMQGLSPADEINLSDLVQSTDCSQDILFTQQNFTEFGQLKPEIFSYQLDASLYDDHRQQLQHSSLDIDPLKNQLITEFDQCWSEMKYWESDPTLVHVKEEHPMSPLSIEFNASSIPNVTAKVMRESRLMGISSNPSQWSTTDVQIWASSVLSKKMASSNSKDVVKNLTVNGSALCDLSLDQLNGWVQSSEIAEFLFVELELWKCALHLQWPNSSTIQHNNALLGNNYIQILPPNVNNFLNGMTIPPLQTITAFSSTPDDNGSSNNNNNNYPCNKITQDQQPVRPSTLAIHPSYFMDTHPYQQQQQHLSSTNDPVLPQFSFFMSPSGNSYNSSPASNSSILDFNYSNITEVPGGSANTSPASSNPEFYEVFGSQNDLSEKTFSDVSIQPARQGNQLWQFLKELLLQPCHYENCIRWLDRSKGIFKIEDSIKVAKLWGQRKNRPAMNYDKLSRSIRQYYKKGIIKKTSQSKRLVYQFCQKYA